MQVMTFDRVVDLQEFINAKAHSSQMYLLIFRSELTSQPWCVAECSVYDVWSERKIHLRDLNRHTHWSDALEFAYRYSDVREDEMLYA